MDGFLSYLCRHLSRLTLGAVLSLSGATASAAAWTIVDIGTLGGTSSFAVDVNDKGQVVGAAALPLGASSPRFASPEVHGFLYSKGVMLDLGPFGSPNAYGVAYSINNNGVLVGGDNIGGAFVYENGAMRSLGTALGSTLSSANGINCDGKIAGTRTTETGVARAFVYDRGVVRDVGSFSNVEWASSYASDINEKGEIVGEAFVGVGVFHAYLYSGGRMRDLGTLGGTRSVARRINDNSQIVGWSHTQEGYQRAFLYSGGVLRDLGTLGSSVSEAKDINNKGHVVGTSITSNFDAHAFLYRDGAMLDLNTLPEVGMAGWTQLISAEAINENGQIVGFGEIRGEQHAFLLSPVGARDVPRLCCGVRR